MQQFRFTLVCCLAVMLCQALNAAEPTAKKLETKAREFVDQLSLGRFEAAIEQFDAVMRQALPAQKLEQLWNGLRSQYGPFQQVQKTRTEKAGKFQVVLVTCQFERGKLNTKIVFSNQQKIAGLFFVPADAYRSPDYVNPKKFAETEVTVGTGLFAVPGTLALPRGTDPVPAVVLVHGSGPHDRDESIGPNKPFRDLAQGLASQGIAVLRYEKRTHHHRLKMALLAAGLTVQQESIDDAAAAVEALSRQPRINGRQIFVLGHSLGGNLLPRIGEASRQEIAGFISLAGSVRPLEDLILEQMKYLLSLDGEISAEEQTQLDTIAGQVERVKSPELSAEVASAELPLGIPAVYWLDLKGYDPAQRAAARREPFLILQGERDYQVTMTDFQLWKAALGKRENVTLISYPGLNHLFIKGEGKSSPAEYNSPGNVEKQVVLDIATWIRKQVQRD